jgi:predicted nucleic-acid-binding protein
VTGLDTNVLVRYLTNDDLAQAKLVRETVELAEREGEKLFISVIVLCELCWVLSYTYGQAKDELLAVLDGLLLTSVFEIERLPQVTVALHRYRQGRAGFADYLIGEIAETAGCSETVTFDRKLKGSPGFRLLKT